MISTSNYENCKTEFYKTLDITNDQGKKVLYNGQCYSKLSPSFSYLEDNKEFKTDEEKYNYYTNIYYTEILSKLDPQEIYNEINYSILLSYEDLNDFSHRHLVAAWFDLYLGKRINEISINGIDVKNLERNIIFKNILENYKK